MRYLLSIAGVVLFAGAAIAQTASMSAPDFATTAASADMFEILSSQLALQNASSPDMKAFAQMMVKDHTQSTEELKAAAQQQGISLPTQIIPKHAEQLMALSSGDRAVFEANYLKAQLSEHEEVLKLMTDYAGSGDNPALKAHAQKIKPMIQMHFDHVRNWQKLHNLMPASK
jgi:putative membrane protein